MPTHGDELLVFVFDEDGNQVEKLGPLRWPRPLQLGQEIPLVRDAGVKLYRVLAERTGEGQTRSVRVTEIVVRCPICNARLRDDWGEGGLEHDAAGPFVVCRHCGERVRMEAVPNAPGGLALFRVASRRR